MIKILRVRRISGSSVNDILVGTYASLMGIITTFSFSCLYCIFTMFKLFDLKIDTDRKRNKMNVPRGRISGWWMKMRTRSRSFLEWLVTESVCLFSSSIRQRLERGKESTENGLFFLRSGQGKSNRKRKNIKTVAIVSLIDEEDVLLPSLATMRFMEKRELKKASYRHHAHREQKNNRTGLSIDTQHNRSNYHQYTKW